MKERTRVLKLGNGGVAEWRFVNLEKAITDSPNLTSTSTKVANGTRNYWESTTTELNSHMGAKVFSSDQLLGPDDAFDKCSSFTLTGSWDQVKMNNRRHAAAIPVDPDFLAVQTLQHVA